MFGLGGTVRRQAAIETLDRIDLRTPRLLIATGIYPPDHGGPARFVPALAEAAVERGWQVCVVTLGDVETTTFATSTSEYRVLTLPRRLPRFSRFAVTVHHIARSLNSADVAFANGLYEEVYVATRLVRRPWIAKIVGDPIWERARNSDKTIKSIDDFQAGPLESSFRIQRNLLVRALGQSDTIITPSAQLARMVEMWGGDPALVIPNGVHITPLEVRVPDSDVVTVCRLVPWKGLEVLIRACVTAGLRLRIVGDGPQRKTLEGLSFSLGAEHSVTFSGSIEPDQVRSAITSGRVFALNSSYEGMSFALLEARERAMPVVVGRNAGNEAVVRSGVDGFVVDPHSVEEVRRALTTLISDSNLASRMGAAARQDTIDNYSMQSTTAATLDLLARAAHV